MKEFNTASIRGSLEQLPTERLDGMLHDELRSVTIDEDAVRMLLKVLREREEETPANPTPEQTAAWQEYREAVAAQENRRKKRRRCQLLLTRVAVLLLVIGLVFAMLPQESQAESFMDRILRWTSDLLEIFVPSTQNRNVDTYEFRTDNPGLQQVYDAVVELGVADPVVPSWLPEGYVLVKLEKEDNAQKEGVTATFGKDEKYIVFKVDIYEMDVAHEYHRDDTKEILYENFGIEHTITYNVNRWVVLWFREKTECFLTLDCPEDTLYRILDSIYVMED